MPRVLIDTGILYAMADQDDPWHEPVKVYFKSRIDTLIVSVTVLPEVCYLLNTYIGQEAERCFIPSLLQEEMRVEDLTGSDLHRTADRLSHYADATIVAIAERLKIRRILTTDRHHFSMIRPRHSPYFELLP